MLKYSAHVNTECSGMVQERSRSRTLVSCGHRLPSRLQPNQDQSSDTGRRMIHLQHLKIQVWGLPTKKWINYFDSNSVVSTSDSFYKQSILYELFQGCGTVCYVFNSSIEVEHVFVLLKFLLLFSGSCQLLKYHILEWRPKYELSNYPSLVCTGSLKMRLLIVAMFQDFIHFEERKKFVQHHL